MKIGVLVTARMGSSRLRDKHLRSIDQRPALAYLLDRIEAEFKADVDAGNVVLSLTTGNPERNEPLAALCSDRQVRMFYGHDDNVPLRHLQAAQALGLQAIVSVDGDDLFCAPEAMRAVHDLLQNDADLARTSGLPLGMNAWGYSRKALETALSEATMSTLETGWGRIFDKLAAEAVEFPCPHAEAVRATLDYDEDLWFFDRVIREVPDWAHRSSTNLVQELVTRGIHAENAALNDRYWDNFARGISSENAKAADEALRASSPARNAG